MRIVTARHYDPPAGIYEWRCFHNTVLEVNDYWRDADGAIWIVTEVCWWPAKQAVA